MIILNLLIGLLGIIFGLALAIVLVICICRIVYDLLRLIFKYEEF